MSPLLGKYFYHHFGFSAHILGALWKKSVFNGVLAFFMGKPRWTCLDFNVVSRNLGFVQKRGLLYLPDILCRATYGLQVFCSIPACQDTVVILVFQSYLHDEWPVHVFIRSYSHEWWIHELIHKLNGCFPDLFAEGMFCSQIYSHDYWRRSGEPSDPLLLSESTSRISVNNGCLLVLSYGDNLLSEKTFSSATDKGRKVYKKQTDIQTYRQTRKSPL